MCNKGSVKNKLIALISLLTLRFLIHRFTTSQPCEFEMTNGEKQFVSKLSTHFKKNLPLKKTR